MSFTYNGNTIDPGSIDPATMNDEGTYTFFFIQSDAPLSRTEKSTLRANSVTFLEYLGSNAWLCKREWGDSKLPGALTSIARVLELKPEHKISPALKLGNGSVDPGTHEVDVVFHDVPDESPDKHRVKPGYQSRDEGRDKGRDESLDRLRQTITEIAGDKTRYDSSANDRFIVRVETSGEKLFEIARTKEVAAIHKVQDLSLCNNVARGILKSDHPLDGEVNGTKFTGKGQIITVADTGFDSGSVMYVHHAFRGRIEKLIPIGGRHEKNDMNGHGTHVCGSALGDGEYHYMGDGVYQIDGQIGDLTLGEVEHETRCKVIKVQGTAPQARLVVQALGNDNGRSEGPLFGKSRETLGDLLDQAYELKSRIHNNSWGPKWNGTQAPYGYGGRDLDKSVWARQDLTVCFAAGNDGEKRTAVASAGQVGGQASAKNCITVGSCDNQRPTYTYHKDFTHYSETSDVYGNENHISFLSSRGPTAEGRIKPDLVAPGTMILSARSRHARSYDRYGSCEDGNWMFNSGTSSSTALVAGCVAALREHLIQQGIRDPNAALVKALLINGAVDLGRPREEQGFGRVDLSDSIFAFSATDDRTIFECSARGKGFFENTIYDRDNADKVKKKIELKNLGIKEPTVTLKATLVYMDHRGAHLQNNINLVIHCNGERRHGNRGNAQDEYDTINNVEQVVWNDLAIGDTVEVEVSYRVAMLADAVPFAVAWSVNAPLPEKK